MPALPTVVPCESGPQEVAMTTLPGAARVFVDRARMLAPQIEAAAEQAEVERQLPEWLVSALVDSGLTRMLLPRALGGAEVDPLTFMEVIEEISRVDASTA